MGHMPDENMPGRIEVGANDGLAYCHAEQLREVAIFPAGVPEVRGTSLVFASGYRQAEKLMAFPLPGFQPGCMATIRVGLTRSPAAPSETGDPCRMAPILALSDGVRAVGMTATAAGAFVGMDFRDGGGGVARLASRDVGTLVTPRPGARFCLEARFRMVPGLTRVRASTLPYAADYLSACTLHSESLQVLLLGIQPDFQLDWIGVGWQDGEHEHEHGAPAGRHTREAPRGRAHDEHAWKADARARRSRCSWWPGAALSGEEPLPVAFPTNGT